MLDTAAYALGTVLAVVGLVFAVSFLMLRLIRPKKGEEYSVVLVFDETEQNACLRVSYLLSQQMCAGGLRSCRILAVDDCMPAWQRQSLEDAFGREPHVTICTPARAAALLFEKNPEKEK